MSNSTKTFFIIWAVIIFLNQVIFFGACFKGYCILNAIPHTLIISFIIMALISDRKTKDTQKDYEINQLREEIISLKTKEANIQSKNNTKVTPKQEEVKINTFNHKFATFIEDSYPIIEDYIKGNEQLVYEYYRGALLYLSQREHINEEEMLAKCYEIYFRVDKKKSLALAKEMIFRTHNLMAQLSGTVDMDNWINKNEQPTAEMLLKEIDKN
nr:hypothetical protein [uncultured Sulfurimonas sp.]